MAAAVSIEIAAQGAKNPDALGFLKGSKNLAAAVWTRDISRAHAIARKMKAGTVWVNCYMVMDPISPFGGYKQSGFGREMGKEALDLYTQVKSVFVKL